MPAITPSSNTRKQLKAFQFVEGRPTAPPNQHDEEKENLMERRKASAKPDTLMATPSKNDIHNQPHPFTANLPPSTPATRLPLADLLGNSDESHRRNPPTTYTPEEHVLWRNAQSPGGSQRRNANRRKRAESSSPATSQNEASAFFGEENMGEGGVPVPAVLKTPQMDPAADLWKRYTNNANVQNSNGIRINPLAHLIKEASPHASAMVGSVSGLRRWASCGLEWPASRSKRRRTGAISRRPPDDEPLEAENERPSKVTELLERMKETLARPKEHLSRAPSSSSPLPEVHGTTDATSPLQRMAPICEADPESPLDRGELPTLQSPPAQDVGLASSDYGEVDTDMFDAVCDSTLVSPATALEPHTGTAQAQEEDQSHATYKPADEKMNVITVTDPEFRNRNGGFESDDDDFFAADIESLVQCYDSQANRQPCPAAEGFPKETVVHDVTHIEISDDEFGDNDIDLDQFAAVEAAVSQQVPGSTCVASSEPGKRAIQRYLVKMVEEGVYPGFNGRDQPEKVLVVEEERTKAIRTITLRESWYDTLCTQGSYVHVIGTFTHTGQCTIDDCNNILILHPDHLISATTVADSFSCMRKAVLQDRVKSTSQASPPLLYGSVLHELFQQMMTENRWDEDYYRLAMADILPRHYETIVDIGLNLNQVHEHLISKLPQMQGWASLFLHAEPRDDAVVKARKGQSFTMGVNKLLDVEEHVWSPMYGLKGNIDATVQVTISDGGEQTTLTVPFEVKTGKRGSDAHVAQTALYTLLLSDRYDLDVQCGILYYLETSEVSRVEAIRHELIHMIIKRNELAGFMKERRSLPPVLERSHLCRSCYAQTTCFLYHKLGDETEGTGDQTAAKQKFDELIKNLKPGDREFFRKWDTLITKEEKEMMRFKRELWTMLSGEREKLGRCFSELLLESTLDSDDKGASKINRFRYSFVKKQMVSGFSFAESQINIGEPIVISDEEGHFALANGYVTNITRKRIEVAVDRRLHNARTKLPGFDSVKNQTFVGIMDVESYPRTAREEKKLDLPSITYRLDKDEFSNGMATVRNNILQIMDDNVFKAPDLRSLIIGNRAPKFKHNKSSLSLPSQTWQAEMNSDQKAAVEKVMMAEDYALVLGMPGTGKTTTIAHIIRTLVAEGKTVLLTSYTHSAVDNILLKLRASNIKMLRLGVLAKIHPEVQEFAMLAAEPKGNLEELRESWHTPPVVAATCLGLGHPLFNQRTFDVCIVDEASQVTLPTCLGPIRMAKTFILVGDHYQLPPLVQNKEAQEGGLDVSLFRLLSENQPHAVVNLAHQYRMCADIMVLANKLIYSGQLKCGNQAVADRSLHVEKPNALDKYHQLPQSPAKLHVPTRATNNICRNLSSPSCHLGYIINPSNKVIFLNTDAMGNPAREILHGNRITNALEATLTIQIVHALLAVDLADADLGVVTFYRSQLSLLRQSLRTRPAVELHTADKFQGRDKEAVIVSFVRSNEDGEVGELLKDWRRVNVAITRARSKLVLVGSRRTLTAGGDVLKGLVRICDERGWTVDLQPGAAESHFFPEMVGSQVDATQLRSPGAIKAAQQRGAEQETRHADSPLKGYGTSRLIGDGQRDDEDPIVRNKKRRALEQIEGNGQVSKGLQRRSGLKVPEKTGKINAERVLKGRAVLQDVWSEIL